MTEEIDEPNGQQAEPRLRDGWRYAPLASTLSPTSAQYDEVISRHDAALRHGFPSYTDPVSGFSVFTADFLAARNYCCGSGCRHCPFEG